MPDAAIRFGVFLAPRADAHGMARPRKSRSEHQPDRPGAEDVINGPARSLNNLTKNNLTPGTASAVGAPDAGAVGGDEEEGEAVEDGGLAVVGERVEGLHAVRHPVCGCHHAGADEGGPARQQADRDERSAHQLDRRRRRR